MPEEIKVSSNEVQYKMVSALRVAFGHGSEIVHRSVIKVGVQ